MLHRHRRPVARALVSAALRGAPAGGGARCRNPPGGQRGAKLCQRLAVHAGQGSRLLAAVWLLTGICTGARGSRRVLRPRQASSRRRAGVAAAGQRSEWACAGGLTMLPASSLPRSAPVECLTRLVGWLLGAGRHREASLTSLAAPGVEQLPVGAATTDLRRLARRPDPRGVHKGQRHPAEPLLCTAAPQSGSEHAVKCNNAP